MASERKYRTTRQRRVILEELAKVSSHPSADEVFQMVRRRLPRISLGTVYRNLEVLSEMGMIRKLHVGGFQKRFDANTALHYHICCVRCGRIRDVSVKPLVGIEKALQKQTDYEVQGHSVEFFGLCSSCKGKRT